MGMKTLNVGLVIDRSGSMSVAWEKTIDACNEYLNSLKAKDDTEITVTVTAFDSESIDVVRDAVPARDCPPLVANEFPPRGLTPLYDAIGRTVAKLSVQSPSGEGGGTAIVVMTDGAENASTEYKQAEIKTILEDKQSNENWLVIFLGEGLDAARGGITAGATLGNTIQYSHANVSVALRAATLSTMSYAETSSNDASGVMASFREQAVSGKKDGDGKVSSSSEKFQTAKKW